MELGVCKIAKSFRNRKMRQGVEFATADAELKLRLLMIKSMNLEYAPTLNFVQKDIIILL